MFLVSGGVENPWLSTANRLTSVHDSGKPQKCQKITRIFKKTKTKTSALSRAFSRAFSRYICSKSRILPQQKPCSYGSSLRRSSWPRRWAAASPKCWPCPWQSSAEVHLARGGLVAPWWFSHERLWCFPKNCDFPWFIYIVISYGPFIVDIPMKNCEFPIAMLVWQRVLIESFVGLEGSYEMINHLFMLWLFFWICERFMARIGKYQVHNKTNNL